MSLLRHEPPPVVAADVRRIGGRIMAENHAPGEVPGRPVISTQNTPGRAEEGSQQRAEGGRGLRVVSLIIATVSACALVGGGIGMLVGVALGVFNPFALGIIGVVVGTCASVPLTRAALKR